MNAAELFVLAIVGVVASTAAALLSLVLGLAAVAVLLLAVRAGLGIIARRRRQRQLAEIRTARHRRPRAEESKQLEEVAQAIAYCYGHGPLSVMDPAYRREFERDARAAIRAMRGRA